MSQEDISKTDPMDAVARLDAQSFKDDEAGRLSALNKARALCQRLETPWDALRREIWHAPTMSVAIKIGQDLDVFSILSKQPTKDGLTVAELAQMTNSDPGFLSRILRPLATTKFIEETSEGRYKSTDLSRAFTQPGFIGGMSHMFTQVLPVFQHLPQYMSKNQYRVPEQPENGPFQTLMGESFFEYLTSHAAEGKGFNDLMALNHQYTGRSWVTLYPVSQLIDGISVNPQAPLVVDVGGGIGSDMENLRQALQPNTCSLLVQELESVVQQGRDLDHHESITFQVHDFFQRQPVRDARAYFMHGCLHDWPDTLARQILQHLKEAMKPGYSKLLICEAILPEQPRDPLSDALDLVMMGLLASKERTEAQWTDLLRSAGFRVLKVWGEVEVSQCVIEAEPED